MFSLKWIFTHKIWRTPKWKFQVRNHHIITNKTTPHLQEKTEKILFLAERHWVLHLFLKKQLPRKIEVNWEWLCLVENITFCLGKLKMKALVSLCTLHTGYTSTNAAGIYFSFFWMTQCQNTPKIRTRRKSSSRDAMSHTQDHRRSNYGAVVVAQLGQSRRVQVGTRLHPAGSDPQGQPCSLHEPVGNCLSEACLRDKFIKKWRDLQDGESPLQFCPGCQ